MPKTRQTLIFASLAATFAVLLVLGYQAGRALRDPACALPPGMTALDPPAALSDFRRIDQNGQVFDVARLRSGWRLLFQCPDLCPTTLSMRRDVAAFFDPELNGATRCGPAPRSFSPTPRRERAAGIRRTPTERRACAAAARAARSALRNRRHPP